MELCPGDCLGRLFFLAATASAQVFRLGKWDGFLEGSVDFSHAETKTGGQSGPSSENLLTQEHLSLRNTGGYIFDPRLVNFTFGGDFGLTQDRFSSDNTAETSSGTLIGYDTFVWILPEKPYSLNLFANRNQTISSQPFGGRTEVVREARGGTLFAKEIYIPSTLSFRQETLDEETRTGSVSARSGGTRYTLAYQGARGWEDSEASLSYGFTDQSDRVFPNLSFQSHDGSFRYSLDFGPELNRRWDSLMRVSRITGATELTTATVDETIRIDHTERLQTNYRYSLLHVETSGGGTTTHIGAFNLRHRLYQSLTTDFRLGTTIQTLPGGERDAYQSSLNFAYTKQLPRDGRLSIGLGGGMQYDDNRFQATESFVPQETHTAATPFALPIQLANPFVDTASIVVTKTAVGALPVGCIAPPGPPTPLVLGRDYTVNTVGDLTEIVPISCSGIVPGINPGDTIAVDYRFAVPTSLAFTTATWHTNISVDYRWIRPYFAHEQSDQHLVSGQDGRFLDDVRSDTVGTELRYYGQRIRASVLGEARSYKSHRVAYDAFRSNQFLGFTILPELTLTLNADEAWFDYSLPQKHTQTLSGRATLSYILGASLIADAFAGIRHLKDSEVPTERNIEAGLRVRWTFRKLEIDPSFEFFDRRRGDTETKDYRVTLHIIRRF